MCVWRYVSFVTFFMVLRKSFIFHLLAFSNSHSRRRRAFQWKWSGRRVGEVMPMGGG